MKITEVIEISEEELEEFRSARLTAIEYMEWEPLDEVSLAKLRQLGHPDLSSDWLIWMTKVTSGEIPL